MSHQLQNYFLQKEGFKLSVRSMLLFILLFLGAWLIYFFVQITFPNQTLISHFVRIVSAVIATIIMLVSTIKLLEKSKIQKEALGLKLNAKSGINFIVGVVIGLLTFTLMGLILYSFVPFHFEEGSLKGVEVLTDSHAFFWSSLLEELTFRGYPLIILSQLLGWRKAVWIMALPFGLSHLLVMGLTIDGLMMVLTTATGSLVFSYAFILTGSLWTAIGAHVISNIMLHSISGLDGLENAMFIPVFDTNWPVNYNPGLISFLMGAIIMAAILFLLIKKKFSHSHLHQF